ncbi:MAG TPA: SpvB/TcaC N-terminal domain-containing protein, partial [Bacteroidales bacterium]|nr:SpvB/TcaC N-terminal domain-containing protein [Bacteroidales bacterium]
MDQEKNKDKQPIGINQKGERLSAPANTAGSGDSRQAKISLPTGGGAIRGIGEKFEANPVTGTASFSVPLTISEGREKFTPQLALSYDSGSGNSVFGLGWSVAVPSIMRKTDKGLPRYNDNPANESDTFILSGAEDLVPVLNGSGVRISREEGDYIIYTYRPRTEGLFALIERWVNKTTHISHWRSISKDNITSVYGLHESDRIYDPNNTLKIFSWLLEESWDAKGNLMRFTYKREDSVGVTASCYENPRLKKNKFANTYLKSVLYGNNVMCNPLGCESRYNGDFHFTLVFDYGDHRTSNPEPTPDSPWAARNDAFSNNKAGFEIRTYRLCRRVLMFHSFTELGSQPVLVRSTDFDFDLTPMFSLLQSVTHKGYQDANIASFPPLTFNYTQAIIADTLKEVPENILRQLPAGIDGQNYQWADLYSEGVSGILTMNNQAWYFMPNYGDKQYLDDEADSTPVFGGMHSEVPKPSAVQQLKASFRLNDIDSDGYPELVIQGEGINGYFSRDEDGKWLNFRNFTNYPNINFNDANLRFMDLSGNGLADIVISQGEQFDIYFSEGKKGYGHYRRVRCSDGEGNAPRLVFSDSRQGIFLADMDGDGLTDIVRISNQSIVYWANRGYGVFSDAIAMSHPPLLDSLEQFDARYVHLTDVDGSGTADLLYISKGGIRYYKNLSGNAWLEQQLPDTLSAVFTKQHFIQTVDILGNGTQCLIFSTALPAQAKRMRYWELTSGIKPFLLKEIHNNRGGITRLQYASSTKFYMQDKLKGRPWITKLPFPVHVLEKVEIIDLISEKYFTNRYAYHHGYYDPVEREFRGFGMVEQWDSELYEDLPEGIVPEEMYVPPAYTKTWFHTGFFKNREKISRYYEEEYYQGDAAAWTLPDTLLPDNLSGEEAREACRALRGSPLRVEIYALDGSPQQHIPYTVEEKKYGLQCLQHKYDNNYAVFLKTESEQLMYHYERIAADPRIAHSLVLETDDYGNVLKNLQIFYPRRATTLPAEQATLLMTYQANDFINAMGTDYRWIGIPYQSKQYQIHGFTYSGGIITKSLCADIPTAVEIDYAATPTTVPEKRLLQHQRTYFWNTALTTRLPLGQIAIHGLVYQQQQLELTQTLLNTIDPSGTKFTVTVLTDECKYLQENSDYFYAQGEIQRFSASQFYQPVETEDAFGNITSLGYDVHDLLITSVTDAMSNVTQASYDYRVLQPCVLTDVNGNSQSVAFDGLGMVVKKAISGKNGEGDTLNDPTETYSYDLQAWTNDNKPVYAHVSKREKHADTTCRWLEGYVYTDGFGNEIMTKTQASDGLAWTLQNGLPVQVPTTDRWLASGKIIVNNKGKAVKQYEPWYSTTREFEDEDLLTNYGVTPIMHY